MARRSYRTRVVRLIAGAALLAGVLVQYRRPMPIAKEHYNHGFTQGRVDGPRLTAEIPSTTQRRVPGVIARAPHCPDIAAKIVSDQGKPEGSLASLSLRGGRAAVVHVGSLFDSREVVAIGYDRGRMSPSVLLSGKDGVCQAMTFEKPEPASVNHSPVTGRRKPLSPSRHTEVVVERAAVDAILERAFELTQGIRVAPSMNNGTVTGMRLFGIRPDSLAARLGFENGDTIERVNGTAMTSPEAALSLYTNLHSLQHLDVNVNRGGKPATIEIRVN